MTDPIASVLSFWFETLEPKDWFMSSEKTDDAIRNRFADLYSDAQAGRLDHWMDTADGALALVILLDQFPRNMFRNTARMYGSDEQAMDVSRRAVAENLDKKVPKERRIFLYLPFEHSENLEDQDFCCDLVKTLGDETYLDYAEAHRRVIRRFGRFPHRNAILGRESTAEEVEFLKEEGSSF